MLPENSQCAAGTDDSNPGPEVRVGPQNRPKNPHHARSKQEYKTKGAKTNMPQCQQMGIVASAKHHITPKVARFEVQSANRSSRAGKRLANTGSLLIQLCPPIGPSLPQVGGDPTGHIEHRVESFAGKTNLSHFLACSQSCFEEEHKLACNAMRPVQAPRPKSACRKKDATGYMSRNSKLGAQKKMAIVLLVSLETKVKFRSPPLADELLSSDFHAFRDVSSFGPGFSSVSMHPGPP